MGEKNRRRQQKHKTNLLYNRTHHFVFYFLFTGTCFGSSRRFLTDFLQEFPTPGTGPYFDTTIPSNITGLVGKNVHLVCKVKNLGNRTVSEI